MHRAQLPRGKRRGDCQEFVEHGCGVGEFNTNGKDAPIIVAEAKRRCLEPTPFAEWNSVTNGALNGYHHHLQHQVQQYHPHMQTGLPDASMELTNGQMHDAVISNGHANGFEMNQDNNFHHHQGGQQTDLQGGGEPAATSVIGYYGYIAHYEHAGSDVEEEPEEDRMDTGLTLQAEYAISGPSSCIEPKERRVCLRCKAGEPGHITHIMHP